MKKLIFVMRHLLGGGAERAMVNLAKGLHKHGYDVRVYLIMPEGQYLSELEAEIPVNSILSRNGLGVKISNSRIIKSDLIRTFLRIGLDPTISKLIHHLEVEKPDLVISCLWEADLATGLALRRGGLNIPWVVALQSSVSRYLAGAVLGVWRVRFTRSIYKNANAVIGCSRSHINDAIKILDLDPGKTHYIFNGIDTEALEHQVDIPLDPSSVDPSLINLISIARLVAVKRLDLLIDAYKTVYQRYPQTHLHILGEGRLRGALKHQIKALDLEKAVTFHGFQTNPFNYLRHSDLFIHCSDCEPFGNVVAEALLVGTPVVATRTEGPKEMIVDGETGLLVKPGDRDALSSSIVRLIADPKLRSQLASRGREHSWKYLTMDEMVNNYEFVFSNILS